MGHVKIAHFSPGHTLFLMVFITIGIGTLLLSLPTARATDVPLLDLIFTATSATCVTGLFTIPLENFTTTGHIIILILSQIGGIGLVTLTIFLLSFFINLGFAGQLMAGQLLHLESWKNIRTFIAFIIGVTLCVELLGAFSFFSVLSAELPLNTAIFHSLFCAVASFCNTGIILPSTSTLTYSTSLVMSLTATALMIVGSLGFITWNEIIQWLRSLNKHKRYNFSLHSKIVLYGTMVVIAATVGMFVALEWRHALAHESSLAQRCANALFQAVAFRSAGFTTPAFFLYGLPTLLLILVVAFIGGSPGSTGGGVKITNIAILIATIKSATTGRFSVELRGRTIPMDQVYRALSIIALSCVWIFATTFVLTLTEPTQTLTALLFEASSAFCTLGMSLGATKALSVAGKIIIITSMIIGRIGSLTLVLTLKAMTKRKQDGIDFSYPEERVILS